MNIYAAGILHACYRIIARVEKKKQELNEIFAKLHACAALFLAVPSLCLSVPVSVDWGKSPIPSVFRSQPLQVNSNNSSNNFISLKARLLLHFSTSRERRSKFKAYKSNFLIYPRTNLQKTHQFQIAKNIRGGTLETRKTSFLLLRNDTKTQLVKKLF